MQIDLPKLCAFLFLLGVSTSSFAQNKNLLTLEDCLLAAKENYPMVKQYDLIEKTTEYSLQNANRHYWPQVNLNGQATYQSDVTQLPSVLPNTIIPTLSKDQYKLFLDINQPLTDLYTRNQQKELITLNKDIDRQKLEVELYKLRDRVQQLYFGILLIAAQEKQLELLRKDLNATMSTTRAAIANGVALKTNEDQLEAELLKLEQKDIELSNGKKGFSDMLSLFINQRIDENTVIATPEMKPTPTEINRPEFRLFDAQNKTFDLQNDLITAKNLPRFGLFLQSGYGRPALNVLKNDFDFYYIGGLRLNWNLSGYYTSKNEREILKINYSLVNLQKESFTFNTQLAAAQQNNEMAKLKALLKTDNEIIALRAKITATAQNQLTYGTITTSEYLSQLNAEDQAKQNRIVHEIQLLQANYNLLNTTGN